MRPTPCPNDAVLAGQVERMWVERGYWLPGKLADGGKQLLLLDAKGAHGVVPDIVDRVIERAALAGAHVEMVEQLSEAEDHRIAAQLRHPVGQDESVTPEGLLERMPVTTDLQLPAVGRPSANCAFHN